MHYGWNKSQIAIITQRNIICARNSEHRITNNSINNAHIQKAVHKTLYIYSECMVEWVRFETYAKVDAVQVSRCHFAMQIDYILFVNCVCLCVCCCITSSLLLAIIELYFCCAFFVCFVCLWLDAISICHSSIYFYNLKFKYRRFLLARVLHLLFIACAPMVWTVKMQHKSMTCACACEGRERERNEKNVHK